MFRGPRRRQVVPGTEKAIRRWEECTVRTVLVASLGVVIGIGVGLPNKCTLTKIQLHMSRCIALSLSLSHSTSISLVRYRSQICSQPIGGYADESRYVVLNTISNSRTDGHYEWVISLCLQWLDDRVAAISPERWNGNIGGGWDVNGRDQQPDTCSMRCDPLPTSQLYTRLSHCFSRALSLHIAYIHSLSRHSSPVIASSNAHYPVV